MKVKKEYLIVTFHTTADAIHLEKACKERKIEYKLIPAPRTLTPGCGIALRSPKENSELIYGIIEEEAVDTDEKVIMEM